MPRIIPIQTGPNTSPTPPPPPPPIPAPVLQGIAASSTQINLRASYTPGPAVLTYTFQQAPTAAGPWTTIAVQAGPLLSVATGLIPSTQYYFQVDIQTSENPSRTSAWSSPVLEVTTLGASIPVPTPTLAVSAVTATTLTLTAAYTGPPTLATYTFQYSAVGFAGPWTSLGSAQSGNTYAVTGLSASTEYWFQVTVQTTEVPSRTSAPGAASATTTAAGLLLPGEVINLAYSATQTSITVTWPAPTTGGAVATYTISFDGAVTTGLTSPTFTQSGLAPGSSHNVIVTAVNGTGSGPPSSTLIASTQSSTSGSLTVSGWNSTLLAYINSLAGTGKFVLGQHLSCYDSNPFDYMDDILSSTGKQPAIAGVFAAIAGNNETNWVGDANTWIAKGGIVEVTWNYPGPNNNDGPPAFAPGTPSNWNSIIDALAAQLKQINGQVILRLWPEYNGSWEGYGPNWQSPAQGAALFAYTVQRLIADGVNNCLMMYNINAGVGNYAAWYPGAAYADIVSCDAYPPSSGDVASGGWYPALVALNKPVMLGECGGGGGSPLAANSFNNYNMVKNIQSIMPKVWGGCIWCQTIGIPVQLGESNLMNDATIITLENLPAGVSAL